MGIGIPEDSLKWIVQYWGAKEKKKVSEFGSVGEDMDVLGVPQGEFILHLRKQWRRFWRERKFSDKINVPNASILEF